MPGWNTSIACTNNGTGGTTTATGGVATIVLDPGATVTCTYTNTDVRGSIEIIKDVVDFNLDDASDAQDFAFTASGTPSTLAPSPFVLDDDAGAVGEDTVNADTQVFENVVPGTYTITETTPPPDGWVLSNIVCSSTGDSTFAYLGGDDTGLNDIIFEADDNRVVVTLDPAASDDVGCTFTNQDVRGSIVIVKDAVDNNAQDFAFATTGHVTHRWLVLAR